MSGVNKVKLFISIIFGISLLSSSVISVAGVTVEIKGDVAVATTDGSTLSVLDYANAKHMPVPRSVLAPANMSPMNFPGEPGFSQGGVGAGKVKEKSVPPVNETFDDVSSQEFGTQNHPFTTSRVDILGLSKRLSNRPYYRESGKLFFKIGGSTFVCSASLIKPGVIVTAAHCVADFGTGNFYSNWEFHAGRYGNKNLGGIQQGVNAWVMTSYLNGTETCASFGVICPNDVAVIQLAPESGTTYIGHLLGWNGYGWNGWGFTSTTPFAAGLLATQVTQLGYPVSHDGGNYMQRTDSLGFTDASLSNNTVIGTRQTGGASGGPWINNFGELASLSGTGVGTFPDSRIIIGVTSWGYVSSLLKQQGASPFTSGNITILVDSVCPLGTEAWCS